MSSSLHLADTNELLQSPLWLQTQYHAVGHGYHVVVGPGLSLELAQQADGHMRKVAAHLLSENSALV